MTVSQFRLLGEMEKVSAILQYGRLMAQSVENDSRIFLYRLSSFYVAACYSASNDHLKDITCFLEVEQNIPHFRKQLISIHPAEREYHTPEV